MITMIGVRGCEIRYRILRSISGAPHIATRIENRVRLEGQRTRAQSLISRLPLIFWGRTGVPPAGTLSRARRTLVSLASRRIATRGCIAGRCASFQVIRQWTYRILCRSLFHPLRLQMWLLVSAVFAGWSEREMARLNVNSLLVPPKRVNNPRGLPGPLYVLMMNERRVAWNLHLNCHQIN